MKMFLLNALFLALALQSNVQAIYNGEAVAYGEELQSVGLEINGVHCGGVFIRHDVVLTAAHCFYDDDARKVLVRKFAIQPNHRNETYPYRLKKLVLNPNFKTARNNKFTTVDVKHDFALLKVEQVKKKSDRPVFSPVVVELYDHGVYHEELKLVGMGLNSKGTTKNKYRARYKIFDYFSNAGFFRVSPEEKNISICKGDSGSGVFSLDNTTGAIKLVGVISASEKECGKEGQRFYVASIRDSLGWIEEQLALL